MTVAEIEAPSMTLDQYVPQLSAAEIDELRTPAQPLQGQPLWGWLIPPR